MSLAKMWGTQDIGPHIPAGICPSISKTRAAYFMVTKLQFLTQLYSIFFMNILPSCYNEINRLYRNNYWFSLQIK